MKVITGYLIDRETGNGISGKAVEFNNLAGSPITTASTYAQSVSSTTGSDGKFSGWFELSPGPVNVKVTVAADEVKIRKNDETAQVGASWMSDLQRLGHAFNNAVLPGFLNQLAVTTPSGHNIVIATGGVVIDGILFSIENGPMTVTGTANSNPALNPRLDLVTLRQYKATAAGQLSGKQEVVVTLGTAQSVVPAVPTGADFTDYPLAVVSTGYNAATKTVHSDLRKYTQNPTPEAPKVGTRLADAFWATTILTTSYVTIDTITITGLNPADTYDGDFVFEGEVYATGIAQANEYYVLANIANTEIVGGAVAAHPLVDAIFQLGGNDGAISMTRHFSIHRHLAGITGVSSYAIPIDMRKLNLSGSAGVVYIKHMFGNAMLKKRV